jgi:hypothetical protein
MACQNNYVFDRNTLTLYLVCEDKSLIDLKNDYPEIVNLLSEAQRSQYNFWLSLSKSQKQYISEQLEHNDCIVANIKLYPVQRLEY